MKARREVHRFLLASVLVTSCTANRELSSEPDRSRLLNLHAEVMEAHRAGNVELILRSETDSYVVANRGAVTHPTTEQRRAQLGRYLASTHFDEYSDVVAPTVTVSGDGSLGWVIVQVRARGKQTAEDGSTRTIDFESAWIELYEKRGMEWFRVGNVSNFKP